MSRLLTLLMMIALVVAPSAMVSASICRHKDAVNHERALESSDARVSNGARTEETAAGLAKKGTLSDEAATSLLADVPSPTRLTPPVRTAEPFGRLLYDDDSLPGLSPSPLLEPPTA